MDTKPSVSIKFGLKYWAVTLGDRNRNLQRTIMTFCNNVEYEKTRTNVKLKISG